MNDRVTTAAIKWWENNRPVKWSLEEHLENPRINTRYESEGELADAVAEYIIDSIKFNKMLDEGRHVNKVR